MDFSPDCLLCGSGESLPFYNFGYTVGNPISRVENLVCTNCGLVFQRNSGSSINHEEYYSNYSVETQPDLREMPYWYFEYGRALALQRLEFIEDLLEVGDNVLDVGCGYGALLNVLKTECPKQLKLKGINPEQLYVDLGRNKYGLDIQIGMLEDQSLEENSQNLVILDNVLEHFRNPKGAIRKIYASLKDDGLLYIVTNNLDKPHGFYWQNFFDDHTVTFSKGTLRCLLESEGLEIREDRFCGDGHITYQGYSYPYIQCIAIKKKRVERYDFSNNGDDYKQRVKQRDKYIKNFFSEEGFAKRLFEVKESQIGRAMRFMVRAAGVFSRMIGVREYIKLGHTLPSKDHLSLPVAVCACDSLQDVENAKLDLKRTGFLPPTYIILRSSNTVGFEVVEYPAGLDEEPPTHVKRPEELLWWVNEHTPMMAFMIYLRYARSRMDEANLRLLHVELEASDKGIVIKDFGEEILSLQPFEPQPIMRCVLINNDVLDKLMDTSLGKGLATGGGIRFDEAVIEFAGSDKREVKRRKIVRTRSIAARSEK